MPSNPAITGFQQGFIQTLLQLTQLKRADEQQQAELEGRKQLLKLQQQRLKGEEATRALQLQQLQQAAAQRQAMMQALQQPPRALAPAAGALLAGEPPREALPAVTIEGQRVGPTQQEDLAQLQLWEARERELGETIRRMMPFTVGEEGARAVTRLQAEQTNVRQHIDTIRKRLTPGASDVEQLTGVPLAFLSKAEIQAADKQLEARRLARSRQQGADALERALDKPIPLDEAGAYGVAAGTTYRQMQQQGFVPPLTKGSQVKAFEFGSQAKDAHAVVSALEAQGQYGAPYLAVLEGGVSRVLGGAGAVAGTVGGGWLGGAAGGAAGYAVGELVGPLINVFRTPQQQLYHQAVLDFIGAKLRKESGANITAQEYDREYKRYFPQVGDAPAVIAQKAQAREGVVRSYQAQLGLRPLREAPRLDLPPTSQGATPAPRQAVTPRVPGAPLDPAKVRASEAIRHLTAGEINALTDAQLDALGIRTVEDAPHVSIGVRNALLLRLAKRRQSQ